MLTSRARNPHRGLGDHAERRACMPGLDYDQCQVRMEKNVICLVCTTCSADLVGLARENGWIDLISESGQ
jgi:hypothetical protein